MQYSHAICQPDADGSGVSSPEIAADTAPRTPGFEQAIEYSAWQAVPSEAQEWERTTSRRTGPRVWLRAVRWLIAAKLHPRATATTLTVAQDLAERMDYTTGHVRYSLKLTMKRTGLRRTAVTDHVRYLRELGALVWMEHGTRSNSRRLLGLPGYAGTATVYGAVIPPVWDRAMGHRVVGDGYEARIVVDQRGQVPDTRPTAPRTPSLTGVKEVEKVEVEGGCNDTSRERASRSTASASPRNKSWRRSGRSPWQVLEGCRIAARVRPRVNWTQGESIRRLEFALRPLIDRGMDADSIVVELSSWWLDWRPAKPAAYIRARLAEQARLEAERAAAVDPMDNPEWRAMVERKAADVASLEPLLGHLLARTDEDRRQARAAGRYNLQEVIDHLHDHGLEDTIDLYGEYLACHAVRIDASGSVTAVAAW